MSTNLIIGQSVLITAPHNHFQPCSDTIYKVAQINSIQGLNSVQLLLDGKSCGAVPESKLSIVK